jgi:hypothetical protein
VVLTTNVDDEVPVEDVPLPAPQDTVEVDGLTVRRDGLTFEVTTGDGSSATGLEPYLGQPAHLFAIRQGDLAYTHLHPVAEVSSATFAFTGPLNPAPIGCSSNSGTGRCHHCRVHGGAAMTGSALTPALRSSTSTSHSPV